MRATMARMDDPRFPSQAASPPTRTRTSAMPGSEAIAEAPSALRRPPSGLSDPQLDTPYRPGGWTVRQLVHHVPDSHMNAYVSFKLALTETDADDQAIRRERRGQLPDAKGPVDDFTGAAGGTAPALGHLLESMTASDFERHLVHPGPRPDHQRLAAAALRVARPASHGARDLAATAGGMVGARS